MAATATPRGDKRVSNQRVELARYTIRTGERVVYGHRVLGVVRLVDHPARGRGRRYVIERGLTVLAELRRSWPTTSSRPRSGTRSRRPAPPTCRPRRTSTTADGHAVGSARAPGAQGAGPGDRRAGGPLHRATRAPPDAGRARPAGRRRRVRRHRRRRAADRARHL